MKLHFEMPIRESFKLWSQRLNVVASILATYLIAFPDTALSVLNSLPPETRQMISPLVGFALFGLVTVARLAKQHKLEGKKDGE